MKLNVWMLCLVTGLALAATVEAQPGGGGRGGRGGRGGGGFGRNSIFSTAEREPVQKELGLSTEDVGKVKTVVDSYNDAVREATSGIGDGNPFNMSAEDRAKRTEATKATAEKFLPKLKETLTADQFTRLQQIYWQILGSAALSEPEIEKGLPIAKDQKDKIASINTEYDAKRRELFAGGGGGGGGGGRGGNPEAFAKMQEQQKERDTKITEVLTKDQQDKFASLKGAAFDVAQFQFGGRGGRGGGGGGGGGGGAGDGGGRAKRPQPKAE